MNFKQLYLMLYEICCLDIPSILALSFYVCTTKEDIIKNVCKTVLNEVQTQYQYWNNFAHNKNLLVFLIKHECFWQTIILA